MPLGEGTIVASPFPSRLISKGYMANFSENMLLI